MHYTATLSRRRPPAGGLLVVWAVALPLLMLLAGCPGSKPLQVADPPAGPVKFIPSYDDTIRFYGDVPSNQKVLVTGYGLVILPQKSGSGQIHPGIRKELVGQMTRMRLGETSSQLRGLSIEQIISSPYTAVVLVRGLMPAGGLRGQNFDVMVTAIEGTQTTSLEGGVLIRTEMSIWRRGRGGGLIHGGVLAMASGPVFQNPFAQPATSVPPPAAADEAASSQPDAPNPGAGAPIGTPIDLRTGWVLGGAAVLADQPIKLILREPNYRIANIAGEQIDTVFPTTYLHGAAHPINPAVVELKVPVEFRNQVDYWLALVEQVYCRRETGFADQRMVQLANEMTWPNISDSERLRVALSFIVMGRIARPMLERLYNNDNLSVSFHAAYAGLRIGDNAALRKMLEIVNHKGNPYRLQAIQALGQPHPFRHIGDHHDLIPLLDEEDPQVRSAAYHAMLRLGSSLIQSREIGLENVERLGFKLDTVRCGGPYLIYFTRSDQPRMAVFGADTLRMVTPVFLHDPRTGLTLTARQGDRNLTLIRVDPRNDQLMVSHYDKAPLLDAAGNQELDPITSQPVVRRIPVTDFTSSFLVADVIRLLGSPPWADADGRQMGLGLSYSQVLSTLYQLSQLNAIPAKILPQEAPPSSADLTGQKERPLGPDETITAVDNLENEPDVGSASQPDAGESQSPIIQIEPPARGAPKIGG